MLQNKIKNEKPSILHSIEYPVGTMNFRSAFSFILTSVLLVMIQAVKMMRRIRTIIAPLKRQVCYGKCPILRNIRHYKSKSIFHCIIGFLPDCNPNNLCNLLRAVLVAVVVEIN